VRKSETLGKKMVIERRSGHRGRMDDLEGEINSCETRTSQIADDLQQLVGK
jgi:hypothetical protein